MVVSDSTADVLRSPVCRQAPLAELGQRALESTDLDGLLADDLEVRINEADAEISVDSLLRVYGDPGQLRQLFQNLLDNSITYSGDRAPRISVFDENTGAIWRGSVHGRGIDSSDTDRIFQVFDRHLSREEYDGTDIGLALCQRITERHGVRPNSVRPGSTFTIELPTVPDADDAVERAPASEADTETDSTTEPVTDE
ncbi:hypothetical protein CP556_03740 [Natrinema sp. CBA1119]|uniref:sensor histidine kinase n=1 Tax=Natrinema sp. CBA1119 TaxID=1608465 RepID=UPI000BFA4E08|nr:ATP-binding protein [Natrinema sp. CBA1119]PGF15328.1 hypothetical protein CP556_03740 [Natrinema sp. CBA1119]